MEEKTKRNTVRTLGWVVAAIGITVMIGWVLDIPSLKSVHPALVTMKFTTALSFALTGSVLLGLVDDERARGGLVDVLLPILGLVLVCIMGAMFVSTFTGIRTGIEDLFVRESSAAIASVVPGRPSVGTMVAFLLVAAVAMAAACREAEVRRVCLIAGSAVALIGIVAFIGYVSDVPLLYYLVEGESTGMAMHTALAFVLVGAGILLARPAKGGATDGTDA